MKTNKIITILFLLFTIVMYSSCKKQIKEKTLDELVPKTQTGANTFGCLMNGQIVTAIGEKGAFTNGGVNGRAMPDEFFIWVVTQKPRRDFDFTARFDFKPGVFKCYLKEKNYISILDSVDVNGTLPIGSNYYETNDSTSGIIEVTKIDAHTLSGTFNFDAQNNKKEIIHFTDGRFDIKY